ncbi:MAG TPA: tRNA pseudouridine(55) synthase TruB [Steroidobacteraceae bacterium]|nr:tRNA pseudouridine(55) synthase TruB [Steroidobacteraceae bacterium]
MLSGVLLLDKPHGLSSSGASQRVRWLLGAAKAGHVGSLDPLATGMLPVCLGEATKIAGEIVAGRKCYRFEVALGAATDTGDREGAVIETASVPPLDEATVVATLGRFRGRQLQVPPMFSALKRAGQPLYRLARAGIEVARAPREIEIDALALRALAPDAVALEACCSKGTYIRVLASDIARALGTCGHVRQLRRLYVAPFEREPMVTLEALQQLVADGAPVPLLPPEAALPGLPAVAFGPDAAARLAQGQAVLGIDATLAGRVRLHDERGRFLGLGEADGRGAVRPRRMFVDWEARARAG